MQTQETANSSGLPTNITSLPTELVQEIAKYAHKDIVSLRSICRDICFKLDNVFVDKYFTSRTHLTTRQSLEALAEIVKSPRLRQALRKIEFEIVLLCEMGLEHCVPGEPGFGDCSWTECKAVGHFEDFPDAQRNHPVHGESSSTNSSEGQIFAPAELAEYVRPRFRLQRLDCDNMIKFLSDIFSELARDSTALEVKIMLPFNGDKLRGFGRKWLLRNAFPVSTERPAKKMYSLLHRTVAKAPNEDYCTMSEQKKTAATIFKALWSSQLDLHSLNVDGGREQPNRHSTWRGALYRSFGATQIFSRLKVISLITSTAIFIDVLGLLEACRQLEEINLCLQTDPRLDKRTLRDIAAALASNTTLKRVTLMYAEFSSVKYLTRFFRQFKPTLEKVYFAMVRIDAEQEWRTLFSNFSTFPKLENFDIDSALGSRAYATRDDHFEEEPPHSGVWERKVLRDRNDSTVDAAYRIRGKEAVKQELEKLASTHLVFKRNYTLL